VKNLSPKRSAVRLVVACQLADDSLDPVHLVADEPSAALGVRQSLEVVVFVQLLDP
jgi:ABC-type glutathione transport system ATPase component